MSLPDLPADVIRLICSRGLDYYDYANLYTVNKRLYAVIDNSWSLCAQQHLTSTPIPDVTVKSALREFFSYPQYIIAVQKGYEMFIQEHYDDIQSLSLENLGKLIKTSLLFGRLSIYKTLQNILRYPIYNADALSYAVVGNNLDLVKYVIQSRNISDPVSFNWGIDQFFSAYQLVSYDQLPSKDWNFDIVELLLSLGGSFSDVGMSDGLWFTAKHVRYLLTKGFVLPVGALSMILYSRNYTHISEIFDIVRLLVEDHGQSPSVVTRIKPEFYGIPGFIKYLIEHGLSDDMKCKALWHYVYSGPTEMVDDILSTGFDIKPDDVRQMLLAANTTGNVGLLEVLVKYNADLSILSEDLIRDSRFEVREFIMSIRRT